MIDLASLLASIPRLTLPELCVLVPQLAACLKACEVRLALAEGRQVEDSETFLNVQEVAALLRVSKHFVYTHGHQWPGRIELGRKKGGKIIYSKRALLEWLASQEQGC
jgi:hypothetical protein